MWFKRSIAVNSISSPSATTKAQGDLAEERALRHLLRAGLMLVARNFKTPGRGGGEVDLIMRDAQGTLIFVEVRKRSTNRHGGAAASVTAAKQRRIQHAAAHYLSRLSRIPSCRFDVVAVQAEEIEWIQTAFDAST